MRPAQWSRFAMGFSVICSGVEQKNPSPVGMRRHIKVSLNYGSCYQFCNSVALMEQGTNSHITKFSTLYQSLFVSSHQALALLRQRECRSSISSSNAVQPDLDSRRSSVRHHAVSRLPLSSIVSCSLTSLESIALELSQRDVYLARIWLR